ncbi:MAG: TonB-dependent receptor [Rubricoccaceae bacterium]
MGFLLGTALPAQAQDPQLPSLSPGVFEVRGPVRVSLPQIERQPLSGFGPALPVFTVGPRAPIQRPFVPDIEALPDLSLVEPAEPPTSLAVVTQNRVEAGAGTRFARYGRADLSFGGASGQFYVDADYDGLSVTDQASLQDDLVDFDHVTVRAGGQSFAPGRFRLDGQVTRDSYTLAGLAAPDERRVRRHVGVDASSSGVGALPFDIQVGYANAQLTETGAPNDETSENRVDALANVALLDRTVRIDGAAGTSGLEGGIGTDVQYGVGGASLAIERASGLRLVVGARGLTYRSTEAAGGGDAQQIGPIVDLQLPLGDLRLFATNNPHLALRSVTSLSRENPYVTGPLSLAPDVYPIDAKGGVELRRGGLRARGFATLAYAPTFLVFEQVATGLYAQNVLNARTVGVGGDATFISNSGVTFSASAEFRNGRTGDGATDGGEIPFYAPLVGRAGVSVPFSRGRIGLAAYGEAGRPMDRSDQTKAPSWGRLELDARYDISGPFSAVLRGQHLLGTQERWPGFREPGVAIEAGVRMVW